MLGWVISCHDDRAQEMLEGLEKKYGPLAQCRAVNFWRGLSVNMLSRMMCDALHATDSGEGVIFLTDISGAAPYRVASLMSHKHSQCEVYFRCQLFIDGGNDYLARVNEQFSISRPDCRAWRAGCHQSLASAAEKSAFCIAA
ncbi:putative PTS system IIA component [Salmonella sp. NCTC 11881]|nr:putative PTS system IIA component [Salmonella sp. NCTC 11881]